jgi:peptide-methionine (S)-S-oxide reductase
MFPTVNAASAVKGSQGSGSRGEAKSFPTGIFLAENGVVDDVGGECMRNLMFVITVVCALATFVTGGSAMETLEKATFGGGCFWCVEAVFERMEGVRTVVSGYAGGSVQNPTYDEVCAGTTGHAEVVQITFDPAVVAYEELLETFWQAHDPTTPNRQGADVGSQYRSVIFTQSEAQREAAEKSRSALAKRTEEPIVTEIAPLQQFFEAEEYHQDYFRNNPNAPYCVFVIQPKLRKLEKTR